MEHKDIVSTNSHNDYDDTQVHGWKVIDFEELIVDVKADWNAHHDISQADCG